MKIVKSKINNSGMTLIEILVVILIIVSISSVAVVGHKSTTSGQRIKMSTQKLTSDIRTMQSLTLNLQEHNGSFPDGGWGVNFDKVSSKFEYNLFADITQTSGARTHALVDDGAIDLHRVIALPDGVMIGRIDLDNDNADPYSSQNVPRLNVTFEPPDPETWLCGNNGNDCNYVRARIELTNTVNEGSRYIDINKFGLIDAAN